MGMQTPEAAALKWAVACFRAFADNFTAELSEEMLFDYLMRADENRRSLVKPDSHNPRPFYRFAAALTERGDPLPQELREFVVDYLRGKTPKTKRRPGPNTKNLELRNVVICGTIRLMSEVWGFPPKRNEAFTGAPEHPSAALIVSRALKKVGVNLKERAVEDIWRRRKYAPWLPAENRL